MTMKHLGFASGIALLLGVGGLAMAETPMVSGDEPMNVGDAAQITAPDPSAAAQEKTEEMLKQEAGLISGDTNPVDEGDAAQMKSPD